MPRASSIPRNALRKYCKVCSENNDKKIWMENLGDRIKCPGCGREVPISGGRSLTRPLRSVDPVRFRTAGFGMGIGSARGSGRDKLDTWEVPAPIRKSGRKVPRQTIERFPLGPDFDIFHDQESYQIIINLPYHRLEDIRCEVVNGILVVESLLERFNFLQKFSLPEDIIASSLKIGLKNSILNIRFEKKRRREEGEQ